MINRILGVVFATVALVSCTTATPYQAVNANAKYGFTEQMVEDNRAIVTFAGNSLTDQKTVETYMLYRAAELTKERGFDHFFVVKRDLEEDRAYIPMGFTYDPFYSNFYCRYHPFNHRGVRIRPYPYGRTNSLTLGVNYRGHHGAYGLRHGLYDPFFDSPMEVVRYEAETEIIMGTGPKPNDPDYFSASQVMDNLANQIIRPEMLEG